MDDEELTPWPDADRITHITGKQPQMGVITQPCRHGNYLVRYVKDEAWPETIRTFATVVILNAN